MSLLFKQTVENLCKLFGVDKIRKLETFGSQEIIIELCSKQLCKAYADMMIPSETYGETFNRLCNQLFNRSALTQPEAQEKLAKQMPDPSQLTREQIQKVYWRVTGAEDDAKHGADFIQG